MNQLILLMSFHLLGSVRGAPDQPDESLGSMDHQAPVQQLSSEYFSLANPSDVDALYDTSSGETVLSEHGSSEHTSGEHAESEHASEHVNEHTSGEQPSGEMSSGEPASSEQPSGEQPSGEHTSSEQPSGEQPAGEQPVGEQPSEAPSGEVSAGEKSSGEPSSAEQLSSTPFASTSPGTMLSCYTCAYMTEQGKCLRGEGVCTTQNSQQCMLKKIFEGGKLQFMVQGCENMCPSMNLFSHGTRMQIICCRNQPFCNKV
ncbi:acrosomal protein SP-10 isoform X2 [Marmota marmota marmota]|uniref:acrosomal protein SP-10 isoform X2 n=1 Tax=Marmota marmota marmota TaxID=9994 RepID=UPI0020938C6B|nr:acrosomal protein SP-10 isoform X2 [Marmota marmota marmota]